VASAIGDTGANILEVDHGRLFDQVSARRAVLSLTVETRDFRHTETVVEALEGHGWTVVVG
jgi:threonine dehydratase